ncbi:IS200/IS605 family transposase [Tenacibaculum tangerinum]|uniref:IS200/IS605 family transposase n=1 Tax=Tenacibaculum tangerinum TaxID=3038772 RepID=A0ABY8L7J1_9FLAO|nr:IS200/IS605 family transposase [Tenacibaculum tangerinum]WGH76353.1 IS200/IS605 family transposase [Tenacibaculum tangerinum]
MTKYRKLPHMYCKCNRHLAFTPKYRFQIIEGMMKSLVDHYLQVISRWKDVLIIEINVQKYYIHLVCSIPPIVSIPEYMRMKVKIAIKLFKTYPILKQKPYFGNHFWSK